MANARSLIYLWHQTIRKTELSFGRIEFREKYKNMALKISDMLSLLKTPISHV